MRARVTTHILDLQAGRPAGGIAVSLHRVGSGRDQLIAEAITDADGRIDSWNGPLELATGSYRLSFAVASHFAPRDTFYDEVQIRFVVRDPEEHHHVPLLLSPFGYSTYRGS